MIDVALWAALAVVVLATASIVLHTLRVGISPMPSSPAARAAVLELVASHLAGRAAPVIAELGAGWGTLALALARQHPQARVVAYESSPVPWLWCRLRRALCGAANLELRRRDFFAAPLGEVDVVVCYLFTGAMERLAPKLRAELRDGAAVVSNTFGLRGWTAEATRTLHDVYRTPVYRYVQRRAPGTPTDEHIA